MDLKIFYESLCWTKMTLLYLLLYRGYTDKNSLFGASICSDEINTINNKNKCLFTFLTEEYGGGLGAFALGGLAGVPFVDFGQLLLIFDFFFNVAIQLAFRL